MVKGETPALYVPNMGQAHAAVDAIERGDWARFRALRARLYDHAAGKWFVPADDYVLGGQVKEQTTEAT